MNPPSAGISQPFQTFTQEAPEHARAWISAGGVTAR
jgi:hypothetical protein